MCWFSAHCASFATFSMHNCCFRLCSALAIILRYKVLQTGLGNRLKSILQSHHLLSVAWASHTKPCHGTLGSMVSSKLLFLSCLLSYSASALRMRAKSDESSQRSRLTGVDRLAWVFRRIHALTLLRRITSTQALSMSSVALTIGEASPMLSLSATRTPCTSGARGIAGSL